MLENHPLTWHTKFVPLLVAGLVFCIISFISGYAMIDLDVLKSENISNYYGDLFMVFHIIFALIIVSIWAFYFYRNNALRSFYPLQPFYLIRVFLQLFVGFSLLLSAYYPYTFGAYAKTATLLNKQEMQADARKLNLAYPFLVTDRENYNISHRSFPAPFPLNCMRWDKDEEAWKEDDYYYYAPEKRKQTYVTQEELESMHAFDIPVEADSTNVIRIDGFAYRFFTSTEKWTNSDSCQYHYFIDHFQDVSGVPNLNRYSIYNYSGLLTDDQNLIGNDTYAHQYAPEIHRQMDLGENAVRKLIEDFKAVCLKYEIECDINPRLLAHYLHLNNYEVSEAIVDDYDRIGWRPSMEESFPDEYAALLAFEKGNPPADYSDADFRYLMEKLKVYYFEEYAITHLFQNFSASLEGKYTSEVLVGVFIICFLMSMFFLLFEFTKIISLLISLPVGGLIMIITGLVIGLVLDEYHNRKFFTMLFLFLVVYSILGVTIIGLYVRLLPRKIMDILINFGYFLAPVSLVMPFGFYIESLDRFVANKCGGDTYIETNLENPWFFLALAFIGLFAYLPFIKRWKALEE